MADEEGNVAVLERPTITPEFLIPTPEEDRLKNMPILSRRALMGGCNKSELLKLQDGGAAIFKPKSGEVKLRVGVEKGTYAKREVAAFLINKAFDFDLVPPTVIREVEGEEGSVQQFVGNTRTIDKDQLRLEFGRSNDMVNLAILDYLIWNADRHIGNYLLSGNRLIAIDNGLSFADEKIKLLMTTYEDKVSDGVINSFIEFANDPQKKLLLRNALLEYLKSGEVDACFARIEYITAQIINKKTVTIDTTMSYNPKTAK